MTAKSAATGLVLLLLLALLGTAAVLIIGGTTGPKVTGLLVGAALGGFNLALEAFSLSWALRKKPSATLTVSLGGFGLRLVVVSALTLWFGHVERVDAMTFALTYVASFLAFLGLQVWAVNRMLDRAGPPPKKGE